MRNSESLYHSLVETMHQNVFRKDLQGRFTFANQQYCQHYHCKLEDILGKTDFDFFPTELAQKYKADDDHVMSTGKTIEIVEEHQPLGQSKTVVQVEILPKPPMERAANNPWPEWPKTYKMDYGQEEAAAKYGADPRVYLTTAKKFESDENGHVKAIHLVQIKWDKNEKGQFVPVDVPGTEKVIPAQLVLLAMGFLGPEQPLLESLGIERDARSNARAEHEKYTTSVPKIFAAGDCRRGQSLVVWAFNEGRGVAREVDRFLMGSTHLP